VTDKQSTKIPLSDLATLGQLLDQAPARRATEVTKRRGIIILAPKLHELRGKGYTWREVAGWLTEHSVPVTVPALQRYLRSAKQAAAHGDRARATAGRGVASRGAAAAARESPAPPPVHPPAMPPQGPSTAPVVKPTAMEGTSRSPQPEPRRSAFAIRPDTKDI
jgi:hypothetical protein